MAEEVEVLVIGAGLSGLAFASFFLKIHPHSKLIVVDADSHVGGVWSASRNFESFWSQVPPSVSGFSDPPFEPPENVMNKFGLYPAKYFTEYLEQFCDYHVFDGTPLRSRIRLQRSVTTVEKLGEKEDGQSASWRVSCQTSDGNVEVFHAKQLVIATGHTSIPNYPRLNITQPQDTLLVHHKEFGGFASKDDSAYAKSDGPYNHVVVLGAGKSAADLAYDAAKKGKHVSWILRKTGGRGPPLMISAPDPGEGANLASITTRMVELFSPSSFASLHNPLLRLINNTSWGRSRAERLRSGRQAMFLAMPRYDDRPGALPGFQNLRPEQASTFWYTSPLGLTQHDDFWDVISQKVHIYRADIDKVDKKTVILDDGTEIQADVILCGTGWKAEYPFLSPETAATLGLPHDPARDSAAEREMWANLLQEADKKVLRYFPVLESSPVESRPGPSSTMCRLYNIIAPLSDIERRSVVFLGHLDVANSFRPAEAQAIWATAYLDGNLKMPDAATAQSEVARMTAFSRRRYPLMGHKGDCVFGETIWYSDKLMADVGIKSHVNKRSWRAYYAEPAVMADFLDVPAEYRKKFNIQ